MRKKTPKISTCHQHENITKKEKAGRGGFARQDTQKPTPGHTKAPGNIQQDKFQITTTSTTAWDAKRKKSEEM